MDSFPDFPSFKKVANRLWDRRASLLVGAGMSRNAIPHRPDAGPMPNWRDLGDIMLQKLYPAGDGGAETTDLLRLAQEYEVTYGRAALRELLRESIADGEYTPSQLHYDLLSLPWADIFTTNYDTLLERSARRVSVFYSVVRSPEDLPSVTPPRIVKLHGSISSNPPLITTQEDYRTYPVTFAPFVHLVQTSLMEHTFVVLGFSGEDPNFYTWRGWLQDHLGEHAPKIYLCGVLDLQPSKRKLFESQGIAPIDLGPLFPEDEWPENRHEAALRWFLLALKQMRPGDPKDWAKHGNHNQIQPLEKLPPLPYNPISHKAKPRSYPKHFGKTQADSGQISNELESVTELWREERQTYPAWEIAPRRIRERMYHSTRGWATALESTRGISHISDCGSPIDIFFLRELFWRKEIGLLPTSSGEAWAIQSVIEDYNPFPSSIDMGALHQSNNANSSLAWPAIRKAWLELNLVLLRYARHAGDTELYTSTTDRLEKIKVASAKWTARYYYEQALWELGRLDRPAVLRILEKWPSAAERYPFGEVLRAAVQIEVGLFAEAQEAVSNARQLLNEAFGALSSLDLRLLSQHAWAERLSGLLEVYFAGGSQTFKHKEERLLSRNECLPGDLLREASSGISRDFPKPVEPETTFHTFDRTRRRKYRFMSGFKFDDLRDGFVFLQMLEKSAQPLRKATGFQLANAKDFWWAVEHVRPLQPNRALRNSLRSNLWSVNKQIPTLKSFLTRNRVAALSERHTDLLYSSLFRGVNNYLGEGRGDDNETQFGAAVTRDWILALSRLTVRLNNEKLQELISLAVSLSQKSHVQSQDRLYEPLISLLFRLIVNAPPSLITDRLEDLMSIPLPGEGLIDERRHTWPRIGPMFPLRINEEASISNTLIDSLLDLTQENDIERRTEAAYRLRVLYRYSALAVDQEQRFAQALWSQTNDLGLPKLSHWYNRYAFALICPEPESVSAKDKFRSIVENLHIDGALKSSEDGRQLIGRADTKLLNALLKATAGPWSSGTHEGTSWTIDWKEEEAQQIFEALRSYWRNDKELLNETGSTKTFGLSLSEPNARQGMLHMRDVVRDLVLPALPQGSAFVAKVEELLNEMATHGLPVVSAQVGLLRYKGPDEKLVKHLLSAIRQDLRNPDHDSSYDARRGVLEWALVSSASPDVDFPGDLLLQLCESMIDNNIERVAYLLPVLRRIVIRAPGAIEQHHTQRIIDGLESIFSSLTLPDEDTAWRYPDLGSGGDITKVHVEATRLASAVATHASDEHATLSADEEAVLRNWRNLAETSCLHELNRAGLQFGERVQG